MSRLLFALTGQPGSGKSAGAEYLAEQHGFRVFTGSDYLKSEASKEGLVLRKREDYGNFQRRLRICRSFSFITDAVVSINSDRVCSVGIRNRLDVDAHIAAGGVIVAFYCPVEERFERTAGTDPKYPKALEKFRQAEEPEYDDSDPFGQHTLYAMDKAIHWIDTRRSVADTYQALDEIVDTHSS